jgi:two-component system, LytTR family, sensor kinase
MNPLDAALLVNLIGFSVGIALYALLGAMVVRHRGSIRTDGVNILLLTTAALGLLWNLGELYSFALKDFGHFQISPFLQAVSYSALGFLPSVVVHSAQAENKSRRWLVFGAYGLSTFAAILHFHAAFLGEVVPSDTALGALTIGSATLSVALLIFHLRQTLEKKAVLASALLVFAVSALHLSGEREGSAWYIELVAHQSSLPLVFVILYQNYRFAFADLFLKRALALVFLSAIALGLYTLVAVPLLRYHETHDRDDVQAAAYILGLWIATALAYPAIASFAAYLVDKVLLRREDYALLQRELATEVDSIDEIPLLLDAICLKIGAALTAKTVVWREAPKREPGSFPSVSHAADRATIVVPAAEEPVYRLEFQDLIGGRRLLSDEIAWLESIALLAARRIDVLRVSHERCEQESREHEFARLASEAQLTALRSQINPHFLFNALTTIGYLIKASPNRAFDTLLRLTQLLRGVLKTNDEFSRLGDEIKLIESYLDIERARFEERLKVSIAVPEDLMNERVPSLILQPIVENAIKHGISENKKGGEVKISAQRTANNGNSLLTLSVWDSGAGVRAVKNNTGVGLGLENVRKRLAAYYGNKATLRLTPLPGKGTLAEIKIQFDTWEKQ